MFLTASAVAALGVNEFQRPLTTTKPSTIPLLGFGTWGLDKSNISETISTALQAGFRHLDCASFYGNQKEVGKGIAEGLKKTGLNRSDIWITSKLWNDHHAPHLVSEALEQTLSDLGTDYLDVWLMHWPVATTSEGSKIEYIDTWHQMESLYLQTPRKLRNIGLSNFSPAQLRDLLARSDTKPAVHQFEIHPYLPQFAWVKYHASQGIAVTAYAPLGNTNPVYGPPRADDPPFLLENPVMRAIAAERDCTTAQVALAWGMKHMEPGTAVIPKASRVEHMKENAEAEEACGLERGDLERIDAISKKYTRRFNNPSEDYGVKLFEGLEDS
ncbi:MAG: hypothetical protein Q9219_002290 [cf. Caloplaca sp. 3 TL-2023]